MPDLTQTASAPETVNPDARPQPQPLARDADACRIDRIADAEALDALMPQWRALADASLVPALHQEPAWVLACRRHMGIEGIETLAVWGPDDGAAETRELIAMVTVTAANWQWGLPGGPLKSVIHHHVYNGTPLVHGAHAELALAALFRQIPSPFLFESVPETEPFRSVLDAATLMSGRRIERFDGFSRGVLTCGSSSEDYLKETHSKGRRAKFRRWRKHLRGDGALETVALHPGDAFAPWMEEFLALESKGWKGRNGTAVACSDIDTGFFRDALSKVHADGRLLFWKLALDGKAVAMLFGERRHAHISFGKITYDEDHARFTPGALMLIDIMDWAFERGDIAFMDACGRPGNDMIDALWAERLTVSDCLVSAPACSPAVFGAQCKAESARRALRRTAKSVYNNARAIARNTK